MARGREDSELQKNKNCVRPERGTFSLLCEGGHSHEETILIRTSSLQVRKDFFWLELKRSCVHSSRGGARILEEGGILSLFLIFKKGDALFLVGGNFQEARRSRIPHREEEGEKGTSLGEDFERTKREGRVYIPSLKVVLIKVYNAWRLTTFRVDPLSMGSQGRIVACMFIPLHVRHVTKLTQRGLRSIYAFERSGIYPRGCGWMFHTPFKLRASHPCIDGFPAVFVHAWDVIVATKNWNVHAHSPLNMRLDGQHLSKSRTLTFFVKDQVQKDQSQGLLWVFNILQERGQRLATHGHSNIA
ncbi:hypothetical protein VNO77_44427 [Canavalia gladiata]|uniref:Uncharacterized protein n=1 Tax=Canavalia gladiata TaxID=3824 RepID=A0AAN9PQC5_CANGL